MQRYDLVIFCVFGSLSSVICRPVHLFNTYLWVKSTYQKWFNQNIYLGKNLAEQLLIFTLDTPP